MQLLKSSLKGFLDFSLSEDLGVGGDVTSVALIAQEKNINFSIINRQEMIFCGQHIVDYFFTHHSSVKYKTFYKDGDKVQRGSKLVEGSGNAREILALERTILNYLQHLSGVATLTHEYVLKVKASKAKICDTRKTLPGLRALEKYAVICGGGNNHRLGLDSSILIKDNHIAICGSIKEAMSLARLRAPHYTKIEIECDNLSQVKEALLYGADIIMLDNMEISQIIEAVKIIAGKALIDVSGGVDLSNVAAIASAGVDLISIGRLTHSAPAIDIGLDIE